jgi:hypothetical protein
MYTVYLGSAPVQCIYSWSTKFLVDFFRLYFALKMRRRDKLQIEKKNRVQLIILRRKNTYFGYILLYTPKKLPLD